MADSGWTGAARNAGNTLYIYVCVCVHGCTFECQGLEEGSLLLRSCHVSLSTGAHPAWQPHTHSGASSTRRLEETPRLCAMNGSLLTLCFPHHDGLIMTDLNCVGLDVCVCVCVLSKMKKGGEKWEEDWQIQWHKGLDVRSCAACSFSVCICVCVCAQGVFTFTRVLECINRMFLLGEYFW